MTTPEVYAPAETDHVGEVGAILRSKRRYPNRARDRANQAAADAYDAQELLTFANALEDSRSLAVRSPLHQSLAAVIRAGATYTRNFDPVQRTQAALDVCQHITAKQADLIMLSLAEGMPTPHEHTARSFAQYQAQVAILIDHAADPIHPYRVNDAADDIISLTLGKDDTSHRRAGFETYPPFNRQPFPDQCRTIREAKDDTALSHCRSHVAAVLTLHRANNSPIVRPFVTALYELCAPQLRTAFQDDDEAHYQATRQRIASVARILAHHHPPLNIRPYQHSYPTAPLIAGPDAASQYTAAGGRHQAISARLQSINNSTVVELCSKLLNDLNDRASQITQPQQHFRPEEYHAVVAVAEADAVYTQLTRDHPQTYQRQLADPFTTVNPTPHFLARNDPTTHSLSPPQAVLRDAAAMVAIDEIIHAQATGNRNLYQAAINDFARISKTIAETALEDVDYYDENAPYHDPGNRTDEYATDATIDIAEAYIAQLQLQPPHPLQPAVAHVIRNTAGLLDLLSTDQTPPEDDDAIDRMYAFADVDYAKAIISAINPPA